jgi:hypothetical protein
MPTRRFAERRGLLPLALLAAAASLALVFVAVRRAEQPRGAAAPQAWLGLAGAPRPRVALGNESIVVLRAPSLAQRVAAAAERPTGAMEREWTASVLRGQRVFLARMRTAGVQVDPLFTYARVLDGFAAVIGPRAEAALERSPEVAGVYPVRAAFPATLSTEPLGWSRLGPLAGAPGLTLPGRDGRGVTIALLDTSVDRSEPYLHARVLPGLDVVDPRGAIHGAWASSLEAHGTELAGIVAGAGGPGGLAGVAPGTRLLPIRVAGIRRDALGRPAVYGRTDELLAGLERAVDPSGDGDAHDAVRVCLVGVAEPYASFADSPEARAAAGALALNTLVVAPAGNDGPGAGAFGTVAGPAGAPAALAVGAADLRPQTASMRVVVFDRLRVVLDSRVATGQAALGSRRLALDVAAPAPARVPLLADYFVRGYSSVAGRAALAPAGSDPVAAVRRAAAAGAAAVLLYGGDPVSSAIGPDDAAPIPVVAVPADAAAELLAALRAGRTPRVLLGAARRSANRQEGRVAAFSSSGIAFGGVTKPELVGPGVGIATVEPGEASDGSPRFRAVTGTSAAAAAVAGAAAVLAEARPGLDAAELRSVLVDTAREGVPDLGEAVHAAPRTPAARVTGGHGAFLGPPSPAALAVAPGAGRATFSVTVGRVSATASGLGLVPAGRLDLVLATTRGRSLGLLTQVRDLLPGRYVFAVGGLDPAGKPLPRASYVVEIVAYPTAGGPPTRRTVKLSVQ